MAVAQYGAGIPPKLPMGHGKANKAMQGFDVMRNHMIHCTKVSRSKSTIDNSWTVRQVGKLQCSQRNVKRHQQRGERYDDIEKENMRLMQREIMQQPSHRAHFRVVEAPRREAHLYHRAPS